MEQLAARNGAVDGGLEGRKEGGATSRDTDRDGGDEEYRTCTLSGCLCIWKGVRRCCEQLSCVGAATVVAIARRRMPKKKCHVVLSDSNSALPRKHMCPRPEMQELISLSPKQ